MEAPSGQAAVIVLLAACPHDLILAERVYGRDNYATRALAGRRAGRPYERPYERSTQPVGKRQAVGVTMEVLFASVPVAELQVALAWYEELFGRSADIVPNQNEVMWRVAGNGWLYVIEDPERAGRTVVTISVSDLDQFIADLAIRGISAGPIEAVGNAGRKANVVDADGNVISWIQVVTGS